MQTPNVYKTLDRINASWFGPYRPSGEKRLTFYWLQPLHSMTPLRTVCSLFYVSLLIIIGLWQGGHQSYAQAEPVRTLQQPFLFTGQRDDSHASRPQVSPDGRFVAITIVPRGTETAFLARTELYETAHQTLRHTFRGHTPQWLTTETDGKLLLQIEQANRSAATYWVSDTIQEAQLPRLQATANSATHSGPLYEPLAAITQLGAAAADALVYPETIRVAHHPSNGCRDVAEWQIDVLPFEEYIARVVPAETPAGWPIDALAAQAVAARTYAWRQILAQRPEYDVTDWANFQMMCDERYANSDAAVTLTTGQYLVAQDDDNAIPISAMYSAENGHPTLTNVNVSYLQGVPDPFALGRDRWGHGYGLSQWGAYRRASAGQGYRQILGHYYTNVYLANGMEPTTYLGAIVGHELDKLLGTDSLYLQAMIAPTVRPRFVITASSGLAAPVVIDANQVSWHPPVPLLHGTIITATLWVNDQQQDQQQWQVDHLAPIALGAAAAGLPTVLDQTGMTMTVPYDGDIPLLTQELLWEGETMAHTPNSGMAIADDQASNGMTWQADPIQHIPGVWYGPYTDVLVPGHSYRALFWLRTAIPTGMGISTMVGISSTVLITNGTGAATTALATPDQPTAIPAGTIHSDPPLARLDITDHEGNTILGLHDLRYRDFRASDVYLPIAVDFHLFAAPRGLEFRVAWGGQAALAFDRVEIWQLPDQLNEPQSVIHRAANPGSDPVSARVSAPVPDTASGRRFVPGSDPGVGTALFYREAQQLTPTTFFQIRYMDGAGNLGQAYRHAVTLIDPEPPLFDAISVPTDWVAADVIARAGMTFTATVHDRMSGIDRTRGGVSLATAEQVITAPVTFAAEGTPWQPNLLSVAMIDDVTLPTTMAVYTVTFTVYDQVGNRAEATRLLQIDAAAPTIVISTTASAQPLAEHLAWYQEPVTVTVLATDDASGIRLLTYTVESLAGNGLVDQRVTSGEAAFIRIEQGGIYTITAWAVDQAGNQAPATAMTVAVDPAPPVVLLSQQTVDERTVHLSWHTIDDGVGVATVAVQIRYGDQDWEEVSWDRTQSPAGTDIPVDLELPTIVRARAQDKLGRWGEWTELNLWVAKARIYLPVINR